MKYFFDSMRDTLKDPIFLVTTFVLIAIFAGLSELGVF